eukprot:jgi/Bigna1/126442/aug1.2_g1150
MIVYDTLQSPEFARVNPFKKVPALIRADGVPIYESAVILRYLDYKYKDVTGPAFVPECAEKRSLMELMIHCHDLYIASPNCTEPGFSHSQGAMYLAPFETPFCPASRTIDRSTRAKKIRELWKQLCILEARIEGQRQQDGNSSGQYLVGDKLSLADFTWYPTTIFMEFMLPRVFGWPDIFRDDTHFPQISRWWTGLTMKEEHHRFAKVREQILAYWEQKWREGQFESILEEVKDSSYTWSYPITGEWQGPQSAILRYSQLAPEGKRIGRYIDKEDGGELVDEHVECEVTMQDARQAIPPPTLNCQGYSLVNCPTALSSEEFQVERNSF